MYTTYLQCNHLFFKENINIRAEIMCYASIQYDMFCFDK